MYEELSKKIGYTFNDKEILDLVFTHKSYGKKNNERLEFLGDSILGAVISEDLHNRFIDMQEGDLTRIRASLVRGEKLTIKAKELELLAHAKLSKAAKNLSNIEDSSILATIFEALIGGIYLDSSWVEVKKVILSLYQKDLESIDAQNAFKDPKSRLQENLQSNGEDLLEYICNESHDGKHEVFICHAFFKEVKYYGEGRSKKKAQMKVAEKILASLE